MRKIFFLLPLLFTTFFLTGCTVKNDVEDKGSGSEYEKCLEETRAKIESNNVIYEEWENYVKVCAREKIKAEGYSDDVWCVGTDSRDPICYMTEEEAMTDWKGYDAITERYNTEVYALNDCEEDKFERLGDMGYDDTVAGWGFSPELDCQKHLIK